MRNCEDCIHFKACVEMAEEFNTVYAEKCEDFSDRSLWIKLPCKVGDTVFIFDDVDYGEYVITEFSVGNLQELRAFVKCGISGYKDIQDCPELFCGQEFCTVSFCCENFGKTVFLSREEAERAWEECKNRR